MVVDINLAIEGKLISYQLVSYDNMIDDLGILVICFLGNCSNF